MKLSISLRNENTLPKFCFRFYSCLTAFTSVKPHETSLCSTICLLTGTESRVRRNPELYPGCSATKTAPSNIPRSCRSSVDCPCKLHLGSSCQWCLCGCPCSSANGAPVIPTVKNKGWSFIALVQCAFLFVLLQRSETPDNASAGRAVGI